MADGRDPAPGANERRWFPWTEIFRCFQVALDPRKLAVAALGILTMSVGWWILSAIFYYEAPKENDPKYSAATMKQDRPNRPGTDQPYTDEELKRNGDQKFQEDLRSWKVLNELAGPSGEGRLRTMPWDEYRGPNPYLFVTNVLGGSPGERSDSIRQFLVGSVPVLIEPLVKFLVPVSKLFSPAAGFWTRVYIILCILWFLAVWGFAGGVITRLAAIGLTNKGPTTLRQAVRFVCVRYMNYFMSPLVPLIIILAVVIGLIVYGFLSFIPIIGDIVLLGLGLPILVAAGAVMAVFLIGLVGYPLMYSTLSTEGDSSDTFDALSRSINYVYQSPWQYLWNWLVAIAYGSVVTFFVLFFVSLSVYLGKWAVSQTPGTETFNRKPEALFIWAPQSFGWKELLLKGSPIEVEPRPVPTPSDRPVVRYVPVNENRYNQYYSEYYFWNRAGAAIVAVWLVIIFLMMLGFTYSFYWSAATMIYLLMRKKVDEADLDEIYLEEDEPEAPLTPAKPETTTTPLNVLSVSPPPPPATSAATIPFSAPTPLTPPPTPPAEGGTPSEPKPDGPTVS